MGRFRRDYDHTRLSWLPAVHTGQGSKSKNLLQQGVMQAGYVFGSGTEKGRRKLGVSMKMANDKVKIYKASGILSIPDPVVNRCLYPERGANGHPCVS